MKTFFEFARAMWSMPAGWRIWLAWLGSVNLAGPILFWDQIEAKMTLAAILVAFMVGTSLFRRQGFTRLLGLMHFVWFALIPYLWLAAGDSGPGPFRSWRVSNTKALFHPEIGHVSANSNRLAGWPVPC